MYGTCISDVLDLKLSPFRRVRTTDGHYSRIRGHVQSNRYSDNECAFYLGNDSWGGYGGFGGGKNGAMDGIETTVFPRIELTAVIACTYAGSCPKYSCNDRAFYSREDGTVEVASFCASGRAIQ
ncbi:hypothetical protein CBR_g53840 [Chara braunii]|uniref:Uncharacterized protein n=1 Tax=Chara braunii TaxID=69332 RepID=A0A388K757_CHABU|nr:hypothetical protein CBR_g53840 [Chara braunii]|eukprot:GBG65867.1 hypothetical protein CBR_g53840 [Chara braunii]